MKKIIILSLLLITTAVTLAACSAGNKKLNYDTEEVIKTTITESVEASGTVNPVQTVNIGSQVSGMINAIYVDFNSRVKKGQLLAQIDPSLFQAQVDKARGDLSAAKANYHKVNSMLIYDKKNYERYKKMYEKNYVAKNDLDLAEATYKSDAAQLKAMSASIKQTQATLENNLTNLRYTRIISPVDGVVVSRNVDVGQTVAASFQTPTLFMVAQDLTKMQIEVNVSEADIGKIKQGQDVDYTLDGYSDLTFKGKVSQVRISPTTVSNVVTYTVIVVVDNEEGKLIPGMTANVSIITAKKENILAVPTKALRFNPSDLTGGKKYKEQGLWIVKNKKPCRINIKIGVKNSEYTEVISNEINEGTKVLVDKSDNKNGSGSKRRPMGLF